jgi:hypothetical protein
MSRLKSKRPSPLVRVTAPDVSLEMWRRSLAWIGTRPADNPAGDADDGKYAKAHVLWWPDALMKSNL